MKTRIILTIVFVAAITAINIVLYQAVLPNNTANLAVGQMNEDGSIPLSSLSRYALAGVMAEFEGYFAEEEEMS